MVLCGEEGKPVSKQLLRMGEGGVLHSLECSVSRFLDQPLLLIFTNNK